MKEANVILKLLFCPTETAVKNLNREDITNNVFNVGDVIYDAALHFGEGLKQICANPTGNQFSVLCRNCYSNAY